MQKIRYIVGIDVGTSGIKALAYSEKGVQLGMTRAILEVLPSDKGWMEHDPELIMSGVEKCLIDLVLKIGYPPVAFGCCTFMHSIMPVDEHFRPMGNLQLWNDNRSAAASMILKSEKLATDIYDRTGTPIHPMSPVTKIRQFWDDHPEIFNKTRRFLGVKEWLLYKLTGKFILDYSTASATGLFDSRTKQWYGPALDWCGIKADQLAEPVHPHLTFPCLLDGMLKNVPVVPGLSDGCAANLGSGNIDSTECTLTLGTSAAMRYTGPVKITDPKGVLFSYCLDESNYVSGGASNNCYNVVEKIISRFNMGLDVLINPAILSSTRDDLVYLPWMFGERAPIQLPYAVEGFVNEKNQTPLDKVRSAVTCVIYNLRHIKDKLVFLNGRDFDCIHLGGGLSQSQNIRTLCTSIFNIPLAEHLTSESSALGTALFTARVAGLIKDYRAIREWNPITRTHRADPASAEVHASGYEKFRKMSSAYLEKKEL